MSRSVDFGGKEIESYFLPASFKINESERDVSNVITGGLRKGDGIMIENSDSY